MGTVTSLLGERFSRALVDAATWHSTQLRKKTDIPYVSHLLSVAAIVLEHGGDEDQAIAGLLHDAVEDQGGQARLDEIRASYGPRVAAIVEACTDAYTQPKPPWRERKEKHLAKVRGYEPDFKLVTAADKLHNARAINQDLIEHGAATWSKFNASKNEVLWYYESMAEAVRHGWDTALARLLSKEVERMRRLAAEE